MAKKHSKRYRDADSHYKWDREGDKMILTVYRDGKEEKYYFYMYKLN